MKCMAGYVGLGLLILVLALAPSCGKTDPSKGVPVDDEAIEAVVREFLEAINGRDFEKVNAMLAAGASPIDVKSLEEKGTRFSDIELSVEDKATGTDVNIPLVKMATGFAAVNVTASQTDEKQTDVGGGDAGGQGRSFPVSGLFHLTPEGGEWKVTGFFMMPADLMGGPE